MHDGRFPVELVSGVPVVAAPEEIDITNAPDLRAALLEAAADRPGTLVADMTRTRFCDSSGLHALLAAHKRAQADGGELLLVIPSTAVLRVFAITGARLTACRPSSASPITCRSGRASRIIQNPPRTRAWSSHSSTRIVMTARPQGAVS
jgi:anti-sigma B factor antagonist